MDAAESMDRRGRGEKEEGEEERGRKGGKGQGEGAMRGSRGILALREATMGLKSAMQIPCARFHSTWAASWVHGRGRGAPAVCSQREAGERSQRCAAAQAACAEQPRGRDALCAAAARMRRASSCANARPNRGEPASTDSSRGAAASGSAGRGYEERKVRGTCFLVRRT